MTTRTDIQPSDTLNTADQPIAWRERFDPKRMQEDALYLRGLLQFCRALAESDLTTDQRGYVSFVLEHGDDVSDRLGGVQRA